MTQGTIEETIGNLQPEQALSLGDYAPRTEDAGFEPDVWYRGRIIEKFDKPFEAATREAVSQKGTSRNVFIAATITNSNGDTRNVRGLFNYNPNDLTAARKATVDAAVAKAKTAYADAKAAFEKQFGKGTKMTQKFNEFLPKDVQASQFTYRKIGAFVAITPQFSPVPNGTGGVDVAPLIGADVDVKLELNDRGYLDIAEVTPVGTHRSTRATTK